jgi:GDP-4-dehydro-6-deoxy-D-mannose reductase
MRALVTGITGFSGSHLLRRLEKRGDSVVGLVRGKHAIEKKNNNTVLVTGDLERIDDIEKVCRDYCPEVVFHLAGLVGGPSNYESYLATQRTNFLCTLNLLEAAHRTAPQARVLLVGSSAAYRAGEKSEDELIDENHIMYPVNAYGLSKLSQELLGYQYYRHFDLPVLIVRPFNLFGAGQTVKFVCSTIICQVAEIEAGLRNPVLDIGNLDSRRDFIDVQDAVDAYLLVATKSEPGEAYNACSGELHSIAEVVDIMKKLSRVPFEVKVKESRKVKVEVKALRGDNQKLKSLGWKPKISFQESITGMLEYWRNQVRSN